MLKILRLVARGLLGLVSLGAVFAALLFTLYGGGGAHPDFSPQPEAGQGWRLSPVAVSPVPYGNVAVAKDGRIFFTVHPEAKEPGPRVFELTEAGPVAFPSPALQSELFVTPLGLAVDAQDRLWIVDHGAHGLRQARLVAVELASGRIVHRHVLSRAAAGRGSLVQDLAVSPGGRWIYLADASFLGRDPAIIVYDVERGFARRALSRHPSVQPKRRVIRTPTRTMRLLGGLVDLRLGVDGLALSADGATLYYGAMNAGALYAAPTAKLRELDVDAAAPVVVTPQFLADIPLSGGKARAADGRVLATDLEHGAVIAVDPASGARQTLVRDPAIRWADSVARAPDGSVLIADSALPAYALKGADAVAEGAPYTLWRISPP